MMLRTFAALGLGSLVAASAIATTGPASAEAKKTRATDDTRRVIIDTGLDSADPISLPMMTARPIMKNPARSVEVRPVDLVPKKPTASLRIPTDPKTGDSLASGTLTIKFRDDLRARSGMVAGNRALSLAGQDLSSVDNIVAKFGGTIRQLIMLPQDSIDLIEQKAFAHSNRRQPDLASMMRIEFPAGTDEGRVLAAARELNERPELQWVTIVSSQAILMSLCLQSMVEELLRIRNGVQIKKAGEKSCTTQFAFKKKDGSEMSIPIRSGLHALPPIKVKT